MCGRFGLYNVDVDGWWLQLHARFRGDWRPRYNIAPTQPVLAVRNDQRGIIAPIRWGFVPAWAEDPRRVPFSNINAKAEHVATSSVFRGSLRRERCLILADDFYEWRRTDGRRIPYCVRMTSGETFAFAGLWERLERPGQEPLISCAIITCEANELLAPIHDRMPVILPRAAYDQWLDPGELDAAALVPMLQPCPSDALTAYPIAARVNAVRNDDPGLIEPLGTPPAGKARSRRRE